MTQDEFFAGLDELSLNYEKRLKPELSRRIHQRLQNHSNQDWLAAVDALISDPERRMFPRFGEMQRAILQAASMRYVRNAAARNAAERSALESTGDILLSLPYPKDLRAALERRINGENTQAELDDYCVGWHRMNVMDSPPCLCDEGFVWYRKDGGAYVGACASCEGGRSRSKGYPRIDPMTLAVTQRNATR